MGWLFAGQAGRERESEEDGEAGNRNVPVEEKFAL